LIEKKVPKTILRVFSQKSGPNATKTAILVISSKTSTKVIFKRFIGASADDQNA
jgi:hypothetical protein